MLFKVIITVVVQVSILLLQGLAQSRTVQSFNEGWQFYKANNSTFFTDFANGAKYIEGQGQWTRLEVWEDIQLPHTYNKVDMQLDRNFFEGKAVYQKVFKLKPEDRNRRTFLQFEGVGAVAQLFINGNYIAEHKGAYSMFTFEISNSVDYEKENKLVVVTDNKSRKDVIPTNQFLFPVYGGLYRPVHLIQTAKTGFVVTDQASSGIYIRQQDVSEKSATIKIAAKLETKEKQAQQAELILEVQNHEGKVVRTEKKSVSISPQGVTYVNHEFLLKSPRLWDGIRDPYLYALRAKLLVAGKEVDVIRQPLGLRKVEIVAGKGVLLNGKPYPMYGVCRHQDREGFGSALSFAQHKEDFLLMKEMGVTTFRLAHYQQSPQVYALADTLGFLTWAEVPFVNSVSYYENDNAKQQITELVKQNFNHPSIYIWGVHNEVYSKTADEQVPVLSREMNDIIKTLDPDRYSVSVTGYNVVDRQENLNTDVQGINHYFGWYGGKIEDLDPWAKKIQQEFPEYKIMLSEYGADGNIDIGQESTEKPKDVVTGKSFQENYQTETHIKQWAAIQNNPIIVASYVWNMFEFAVPAWNRGGVNARNLKGLITFDRKRKKDAFYWYKANWNPEPMIYLANRRDKQRTKSDTKIQVFSNLEDINISVNGKAYQAIKGENDKHWLVEHAILQKGDNKIVATGKRDGKQFSDEMIWILN